MKILSIRMLLVASGAALLLGPVSASAQVIFSEDFSDATATGFVDLGADNRSETYQPTYYFSAPVDAQWVFSSGTYLASSDKTVLNEPAGNKAVLLNESPQHALAQTSIPVAIAGDYVLTFDLWGDNQPNTTDYSFEVSANTTVIGTVTRGYTIPGPGASASFIFFAPSGVLQLSFKDISVGQASGIIDNIVLSAIPEPETYAMLVAGLGLLGFVARRRRH